MAITYNCRHCGNIIGKIDEPVVDSSMLGLDHLTSKEKEEMVHYNENGDVSIQAICEDCEEALDNHPHYHELDYFLQ
ncbi:anti-sigma-F factor Fin [Virgibacillus xinjiangensis]|uniref:Anti-sigma-F factor Fin n=1 Tax=Virgibacillus xinjiangensis TaxID=393090 RepID=A0ABV7CYB9_9BACI